MHVGICNMHVETQHLFLMWDLGIIGLGFVNLGNWEALVLDQLRKWARGRAQWHQDTDRTQKERPAHFDENGYTSVTRPRSEVRSIAEVP